MLRPVHDLERLVESSGFWVALVVAGVGCGAVWALLRAGRPSPDTAVVGVVAGVAGLRVAGQLSVALVVGLALLAGGEWLARDVGWCRRALWLAPGAVVVGASLPDRLPFWMRIVAWVIAAIGGSLVVATNREVPRAVPGLFAVGAVGVYVCVPDTETAVVLVGALLVGLVWIAVPRARASVGASALTGLFAWVAVDGGAGRPGSVIGGVACLGVLLLLPLVGRPRPTARAWAVLLVVQVALVAYESRVAGAESSGWVALALSAPAFVAAAAVLRVVRGGAATAS
jgi:hypothetical protein